MASKTLKIWIERKAVNGHDIAATRKMFLFAAKSPYQFCKLKTILSAKKDAHIKIVFRDDDTMWKHGGRKMYKGKKSIPLALYLDWDSGHWIVINSERKVNWPKWAVATFAHEFGHYLGWRHSSNKGDVMNAGLTSRYWSPKEVLWYQKRYGAQANFTPPELSWYMKDLHRGKVKRVISIVDKWKRGKVKVVV